MFLLQTFLFATKYAVLSFRENIICLLIYGIPYRMLWVELGLMIQYPFVSPYRINLRYISTNKLITVIFLAKLL